jgi:succinoglycan biosynthesis transport protein ExoP
MVRKHWALAFVTAAIVTLAMMFHTLGQTKIYQAQATLLFDPHPPRPLGSNVEAVVELGAGNFWDLREYYETQYKILQSRRVSKAVVQDLGLGHDGAFLMNLAPGDQPPTPITVSDDVAASALMGRISVEPLKDSRLAIVKLEDANPERAQLLLNALLETYVRQNLDDAQSMTSSAADWLRGQVDNLKGELESSEMKLHEYKEHKNILSVDLGDQSNMLREEMQQLSEALTTVRTHREEVAARHTELSKVKGDDPAHLPASELLQSQLLQDLRRAHEEAIRDRLSALGSGKGENHPDVLAAAARVESTKGALLAEVKNIQGALAADLAIIGRQEAGLAGLLERAKKQAFELNLLEIEYNRLRRSKDNTEKLYSLVLERSKESDLSLMLRENNIRVLDRPLVPDAPIRPEVPLNIALGLLAGIVLGATFAIGLGLLDRTIKTPEDMENEFGLTFLGLLPELASQSKVELRRRGKRGLKGEAGGPTELLVHNDPLSSTAEAARSIRTNLLFMAPDRPYRRLLVTSAAPSEGKTTVACFIATAMAQAGQRVVLIDCDLRRPRVHRIFGKTSELGVTTALIGRKVDDVILETGVPNLWMITAGPIAPDPTELLHSDRFKAFLDDVSQRFDRVIIDSSPLIAVTDSAILSTLVDGTVVVVRAFKTTRELLKAALRGLYDVGTKPAGAVLNAVNFDRHEYRYSYSYYRRDGYYGEEVAKTAAKTRPSDAAPPPPA